MQVILRVLVRVFVFFSFFFCFLYFIFDRTNVSLRTSRYIRRRSHAMGWYMYVEGYISELLTVYGY